MVVAATLHNDIGSLNAQSPLRIVQPSEPHTFKFRTSSFQVDAPYYLCFFEWLTTQQITSTDNRHLLCDILRVGDGGSRVQIERIPCNDLAAAHGRIDVGKMWFLRSIAVDAPRTGVGIATREGYECHRH